MVTVPAGPITCSSTLICDAVAAFAVTRTDRRHSARLLELVADRTVIFAARRIGVALLLDAVATLAA